MRRLMLAAASLLTLAACSGQGYSVNSEYEYPRQVAQTGKLYAARDACLKRNVQPFVNGPADPETAARIVAATCEMETAKLIAVSNPSGAADVAEAIRKDSEFRATGILLRARGAPQTN
ncbi:MAG: hypothetical protein EPO67_16370 [Reyranella sp.]|jgi:hypothetical protein|nr:MAG: hypothetical protein EPO67_16370 [Reyranella sp.]